MKSLLPALGLLAVTALAPAAIACGDDTPPIDPAMISPDALSAKEMTAIAQTLFPNGKIFSVELTVQYDWWWGWEDWGWGEPDGTNPAGGDDENGDGTTGGGDGSGNDGATCVYEVQMMLGGLILDAQFDAVTGDLLDVYTESDSWAIAQARKAIKNTKTTVLQAAAITERRTGGFVYEAKLDLYARGRMADTTCVMDTGDTMTMTINTQNKRTVQVGH